MPPYPPPSRQRLARHQPPLGSQGAPSLSGPAGSTWPWATGLAGDPWSSRPHHTDPQPPSYPRPTPPPPGRALPRPRPPPPERRSAFTTFHTVEPNRPRLPHSSPQRWFGYSSASSGFNTIFYLAPLVLKTGGICVCVLDAGVIGLILNWVCGESSAAVIPASSLDLL